MAPLLALPYALELNDSSTVVVRQVSAQEFADMIVDEFGTQLAASARQPLVMSVVVHSFISGAPFRLKPLASALAHVAGHRDRVWIATPGRIAGHFAGVQSAPRMWSALLGAAALTRAGTQPNHGRDIVGRRGCPYINACFPTIYDEQMIVRCP